MANKTTKKNNVAIEWPSNTHFTMGDLFKKYPNFVEITLRFRVKRGLENKDIVTIGKVKPAIGRPQLVFAKANPSKELLEAATKAGVLALENKTTNVPVGDVKAPKKTIKKDVVVPTTESTTSEEAASTTIPVVSGAI
jgi:hypothetical protein